jgi:L-fuconolactonase
MSIPIIDTHLHIWDLEKVEYSWLKGNTSLLARTYLPDEVSPLMQKVGVTQAILVQAANTIEETEFMLEAAQQNSWIKGVVGWLPLLDPTAMQQQIHFFQQNSNFKKYFKGVRHLVHDEPNDNWLLEPAVLESLQILAAHKIHFEIVGVKAAHLKAAIHIAQTIPQLSIMLDHLVNPPISDVNLFPEWEHLMKQVSQYPRVYAKISGLGTQVKKGDEWNAADIQNHIDFSIQHFSVDRCVCGGDWPVSLLASSYEKTIGMYREVLEDILTPEDQAKVFHTNATLFYSL